MELVQVSDRGVNGSVIPGAFKNVTADVYPNIIPLEITEEEKVDFQPKSFIEAKELKQY